MPKKRKDVQKESVASSGVSTADGGTKAKGLPFAARAKKNAPRKTTARKSTRSRRQMTSKSRTDSKQPVPSDEQIRLRAYFIAEKRAQLSLPGDTHSDWIEAKRQLLEEAGILLS